MTDVAVIGGSEFIVGFQLAGIKQAVEADSDYFNHLKNFKNKKEISIVVVEEKIMDQLEQHQRAEVESSVDPVFIPLSTVAEQDSLKKLIKKSIGVDLWA